MATADVEKSFDVSFYWLALKFVPRLSIAKKIQLVEEIGLTKLFSNPPSLSIFGLTTKQITKITQPDWEKISAIVSSLKKINADLICFDDPNYPQLLKEIYDPPLVLFTQGNLSLLNSSQIAIVGSRNATISGRENAYNIAHELAHSGVVITSGLALGIDAFAHKAALDAKKSTIAVVATGLDITYPARHKLLAKKIIDNNGLIISEFLPGTPPKPGYFPKRNRIISGLSHGVLVVEATIRSGSLVTARCAIEQNRDVFAIPGALNNPQAKGCHWLIKQGAKLIEGCADILEESEHFIKNGLDLEMNTMKEEESKKSHKQDLSNDALLASVGYEITPVDAVVSRSKLPTDVVLTRLTMLELRGLVSAVPGGYLRVK